MLGNIYYLIPDVSKKSFSFRELIRAIKRKRLKRYIDNRVLGRSKPVGGVKVIYQHCMILNSLGFSAFPVRVGNYEGDFFGYGIKPKSYEDFCSLVNSDDVVIIPEVIQKSHKDLFKCRKVIFVQNWRFLYEEHPLEDQRINSSYSDAGYEYILCCGDYLMSLLKGEPENKVHMVKNFIDHNVFVENEKLRVSNRILAMPRKNPEDLKAIVDGIENLPVEIVYADRLTQKELVLEYQKSDIFLATGYPEGFGLPPLEAMACGAVVIGFTGGGASEFMIHEKTAMVAEDGDTDMVVEHIKKIIGDVGLKEKIRASGIEVSKKYNKESAELQLKKFFNLFS